MTEKNIYEFLTGYLNDIMPIPYKEEQSIRHYRYLDAGHIDSFGIVTFIVAIEERFGIALSAEDTESDGFRSVEGLMKIILGKLGENEV
ncbi:acyl carrier protein [Candidatus Margulisiibacteriota bacterium]